MRHLETKKLLISLTCISSICVTSCIVAVIPEYAINNSMSNEQQLVNKLSSIISNPIIISSDLTASEALYDNNYQTVSKLILNKIQADLDNKSLNINGTIYSSSEIIKHLHITLPSMISYNEYEVGIISNVKLQYITSQGSINIIPNNGYSYTVKGFLVPQLTNTNQTVANSLSLYLKNPIQINDSLTASQALQTNNLTLTINKIKATIRNDLENNDLIINSNITIPINQVLNNIHIVLPNSVTTAELDNGIINNVVLKYGSNNEVLIPNSNDFNTYTVQGFKIPTTNEIDEQNTAIIHKLESLIKNPIVLNNGYNLTAAESISSDANKQILFNSIKEVIKNGETFKVLGFYKN